MTTKSAIVSSNLPANGSQQSKLLQSTSEYAIGQLVHVIGQAMLLASMKDSVIDTLDGISLSIAVLVLDRSLRYRISPLDQPSQHRHDPFQVGLANPI
jgi:hypothetical protein